MKRMANFTAQLLVVGDGPVEIREAKTRGAVTQGVASDGVLRCGWNERKTQRLSTVGADLLASDFTQSGFMLAYLFSETVS